jgi:3-deoxy-manno-octulosonate cytidylyltransferase (CMP-KDO synthetase)
MAEDKTVLQRTWESACAAKVLDEVYVATDHEAIKEHIEALGGNVLWTSSKPRNGTERIQEALKRYPELRKHEMIVNLQGDHPCTQSSTIEAIIETLEQTPSALLSTAATPILSYETFISPQVVKVVFDRSGSALYFSRSPIPHQKDLSNMKAFAHIGIYCYRQPFFDLEQKLAPLQSLEDLEQLGVLESGHRIQVAIVDEIALGVDTPADLIQLKEFLCRQNTFS